MKHMGQASHVIALGPTHLMGQGAHPPGKRGKTLRYYTGRHVRWYFNVGRVCPLFGPGIPPRGARIRLPYVRAVGGRSWLCIQMHSGQPPWLACRRPARSRGAARRFPPPRPCLHKFRASSHSLGSRGCGWAGSPNLVKLGHKLLERGGGC